MFLVQLLSDGRISTGMVDCMMAYLMERLQSQPESDQVYAIETLQFMFEVEKWAKQKDGGGKPPRYLRRLKALLSTGKEALLFPLFWAEIHHFLGVKVDIAKAEIIYGTNILFHKLANTV